MNPSASRFAPLCPDSAALVQGQGGCCGSLRRGGSVCFVQSGTTIYNHTHPQHDQRLPCMNDSVWMRESECVTGCRGAPCSDPVQYCRTHLCLRWTSCDRHDFKCLCLRPPLPPPPPHPSQAHTGEQTVAMTVAKCDHHLFSFHPLMTFQ